MTRKDCNHPLAVSTWGHEERDAILNVLDSGMFTMGKKVKEFEELYAAWVGTKYAVMVNSGSSANLLMVAAYTLRNHKDWASGIRDLEIVEQPTVIVPAVSWSTSYSPFQQYGWKLKFVDVDKDTLNYDIEALRKTYVEGDLILAVNLLGNPNDFRWFPSMNILEDNCESMGATYGGFRTGNIGRMSSHSTFFSHHIQTMEGGIVTTDDEYYYQMLLCLRSHGWTRHLPEKNVFNVKPSAFEFLFPGYNVRPIEMQAAVGIEQLKKIGGFISARRENAERWKKVCQKRGWWRQEEPETGKSSWFAFAIVDDRIEEIKKEFDEKGIEYRPIVAGNFKKSKSIEFYDCDSHDLPNADRVHAKGIYIGNFHQKVNLDL